MKDILVVKTIRKSSYKQPREGEVAGLKTRSGVFWKSADSLTYNPSAS